MTADAVGGVWSYALELARALRPHGVDVQLATMGPRPSDAQRAEAASVVTLHESDYRLEWMDDPWDDVARAGEWLLALERDLAPDVVHLDGYAHGALPWRAPVVVVAHSCVPSWWRAVKGEEAPPSWDTYRAAVAEGIRAASIVVAPTRAMLAEVERYYGTPARAVVVPNGRSAADFAPGRKEPFVLAVGRLWDEAKNVAAVAAAGRELAWPVYVAGDDAPPGRATTRDAAASGSVRWLGRLSQRAVAEWMGRASIYVLPARYEPFGLSALEAALAGCALVLGDVASLREVWGDAAWYVDPDAPRALAAALRTLASDDAYRRGRADACRARALTYTPERMAAGYLDAYATAAEVACV